MSKVNRIVELGKKGTLNCQQIAVRTGAAASYVRRVLLDKEIPIKPAHPGWNRTDRRDTRV